MVKLTSRQALSSISSTLRFKALYSHFADLSPIAVRYLQVHFAAGSRTEWSICISAPSRCDNRSGMPVISMRRRLSCCRLWVSVYAMYTSQQQILYGARWHLVHGLSGFAPARPKISTWQWLRFLVDDLGQSYILDCVATLLLK